VQTTSGGLHAVSEIYGSSGYDRGDSGGRAGDYGHGGDAYDMWGDQDPDAANYADLYDAPADQDDRVADDDDGPGHGDEELGRGMNRAEYADYVRSYEQSGTCDTGDDPWATDPDLENYANGNDPETAWRNQGNPDSPNGLGYLNTADLDRQAPQADDDGDMWGDTYPDGAADYPDTGTTAGTLMAELDHAPAQTPDRPPAGDQRPGSLDGQRYPNGVTAADTDPRYYDGDIQAALAADTRPTRQQAARDDTEDRPPDTDASIPDQVPSETLTPDRDAGQTSRGQNPYLGAEYDDSGKVVSQADASTGTPDRPAETDDVLRQRVADLESANAELKAENTQLGKGLSELETENAELGKNITELKAENADQQRGMSALEARLERLEQGGRDEPAASIVDRAHEGPAEEVAREKSKRGWKHPSDEALLFGAAAAGGALTSVADFVTYLPPEAAGIGASVLAAVAAAVAWGRKRKEG
jgi:hypothetical protein